VPRRVHKPVVGDSVLLNYCRRFGIPVSMGFVPTNPDDGALVHDAQKYFNPHFDNDDRNVTTIKHYMYRLMSPYFVTHGETDSDQKLRSMDMKKSPGFPHNVLYPTKLDAIYGNVIAITEDKRRKDLILCILQILSKNENRDVSKVASYNIRAFACGPLDYNWDSLSYSLMFNEMFYQAKGNIWSVVGMSAYHGEWHAMILKHIHRSPHWYFFDVKNQDSKLCRQVFEAELWLRLQFMVHELREKCRASLSKMYFAYVLLLGVLVRKIGSNASGYVSTSVTSTMFTIYILMFTVMHKYPDATYEDLLKILHAIVYGDNGMIHSLYLKPSDFRAACWVYRITIKFESENPQPIWGGTFLSHWSTKHTVPGFERFGPIWMPTPNPEKIRASWMKGANVNSALQSYARTASLMRYVPMIPELWHEMNQYLDRIEFSTDPMYSELRCEIPDRKGLTFSQVRPVRISREMALAEFLPIPVALGHKTIIDWNKRSAPISLEEDD